MMSSSICPPSQPDITGTRRKSRRHHHSYITRRDTIRRFIDARVIEYSRHKPDRQ
jgi:hypothetical protein